MKKAKKRKTKTLQQQEMKTTQQRVEEANRLAMNQLADAILRRK